VILCFLVYFRILTVLQVTQYDGKKPGGKQLESESVHGVMKVLTQHLPGKQYNTFRIASPWPSP
jgi:hypothetical protein